MSGESSSINDIEPPIESEEEYVKVKKSTKEAYDKVAEELVEIGRDLEANRIATNKALDVIFYVSLTIIVISLTIFTASVIMRVKLNDTKKQTRECTCVTPEVFANMTFRECDLSDTSSNFAKVGRLLQAPCCWGPYEDEKCATGVTDIDYAVCRQTKENGKGALTWTVIAIISGIVALISTQILITSRTSKKKRSNTFSVSYA